MPVIECRCGLVISAARGAGIVRCIRCGRMQARVVGAEQSAAVFGLAERVNDEERPVFVPIFAEANRVIWPPSASTF
jgi:hypothetical protein